MCPNSITSYHGAAAHYLSSGRRDPVKRLWEEPFSRTMIADAVGSLGLDRSDPVRVIDIGAGIGDGFVLLEGALNVGDKVPAVGGRLISYLGLDIDPEMVATARDQYRDRAYIEFVQADVREELPDDPFDVYMSAGVPYSHLTSEELAAVLCNIFSAVRKNRRRSAVLIDVLGRYSIEWQSQWEKSCWEYHMSFFSDSSEVITAPMTFYSRSSLWDCISEAVQETGISLVNIDFFDRSVAVGRHTATGTFHPGLPPYRLLLNQLFDGDTAVDLDRLAITPPTADVSPEIDAFFALLCTAWNGCVADTTVKERAYGASPGSRRSLARALRGAEQGVQRGLGTGHSLIAVAYVDGST